ncbi:MAG: DNA-directed RNA polymerase subunit beta' [Eubacteriaceae bacterium]|nr:DNA-directed RNA polymerase subunit beta' [Eubacteriaceae bacterium]
MSQYSSYAGEPVNQLNDFKSIKIGLASADKIREWSFGEVKKPETINYRTSKPERDGLFCEKIFGPMKDWECHCGKYKGSKNKGIICDRCGVEVTKSKVRRERMGHIELAAPVTHIWYFKGNLSRIGVILDISPKELEKVIYFASYIVTDPGNSPLEVKKLLNETEYKENKDTFGDAFSAKIGAEAVLELLTQLDLNEESKNLKEILENSTGQKKAKAIRRLEVVEAFRKSGNDPKDMVLTVVPVIPPDLRPMVMLDGGRFATSDLNDLYRRVINRNNRLTKLLELDAPDIIIQNEKRMLQDAVDALIDNGRHGRAVTGASNRPLRSLSDMLKGKQGRFRQNLLGKRVDYSGRSVIVVGPELKMYQCGLPKEMAIELFKPFVMRELVQRRYDQNIKSAKRKVERLDPIVWDVLDDVIKDHPVMLNRAPTLHRLGIQAFEPVLVEGRAIKLHPLVCTAYNADFDGDQMAIHVPLSVEAQTEARLLMLSAYNILKPQDGMPVVVPTQDMILGSYYQTMMEVGAKGEGSHFVDLMEMEMAYENREVDIHARVYVRLTRTFEGVTQSRNVYSSVGRFLFNEIIPQNLGFVKRECLDDMFNLEIDTVVDKGILSKIVYQSFITAGASKTSILLDAIKANGFKYSTKSAVSISVADMQVPSEKTEILSQADKEVDKINSQFARGFYSDGERKKRTQKVWEKATDAVGNFLMDNLDEKNPITMMASSGARGSAKQIRQLAGMRGLMASPSGEIILLPIRSNFREGLNVLEFFISSHGARKALSDTALRTSESGYLTRRLVDVCQDQIIREFDCGTEDGFEVTAMKSDNATIESLKERINGRYTFEAVTDPETGRVIVGKGELITVPKADEIVAAGVRKVIIRAVFNCKSKHGICQKCYGTDLTTMQPVNIGEAVGTIAAQSIGEPGTQLTMRNFHTGGVAGADDITQGLPRVEELFEARRPKGVSIISEIDGSVSFGENKKNMQVVIVTSSESQTREYEIPFGETLLVREGSRIKAGDQITKGPINPNDLIGVKGVDGVQRYILQEVQKVYRLQGVNINDRHIEVVIRQMLRKYKVTDSGDTNLLPGSNVDITELNEENERMEREGLKAAQADRILLGITKAALATTSFLSAASFQETTRVLTDAAVKGKVDNLMGLKENIIIGKLIPAGTGIKTYTDIDLQLDRPAMDIPDEYFYGDGSEGGENDPTLPEEDEFKADTEDGPILGPIIPGEPVKKLSTQDGNQ